MSKKKFTTIRYRLANPLPIAFNRIFSSKEEAMNVLLKKVEEPMAIEDALLELEALLAKKYYQQYRYIGRYTSMFVDYDNDIEDLKKYIIKLKK